MTPTPPHSPWRLARRAQQMNPSTIRELLKLTERPGILSLAGGLPAPGSFPVDAVAEACARVLRDDGRAALQYAASEGFGPLREWVAAELGQQGMVVDPARVLITTGSQQGLDLLGKVLIDPGAPVAVEQPTYLGALQAFAPYEPSFVPLVCDDDGPRPDALQAALAGVAGGSGAAAATVSMAYLLPNFQNPSGRLMPQARREALVLSAARLGLPLLEDNPYGELWYDSPPPPPLAALAQQLDGARGAEGVVYLGSLSKVLAPGLRLGYVVAPQALYQKLLQAKQAADLHTPGFNQRVAFDVLQSGLLQTHLPQVRQRYRAQRDAMHQALQRHLPEGCRWVRPAGGMFFWLSLPEGLDATALLAPAVQAGVAFVPGAPFYAGAAARHTLRLSFVTLSPAEIEQAVAALGGVIGQALKAPNPERHCAP
ncbi:MAG: PLP-dependent aminotransferase family protein [Rubrivivax sp.]